MRACHNNLRVSIAPGSSLISTMWLVSSYSAIRRTFQAVYLVHFHRGQSRNSKLGLVFGTCIKPVTMSDSPEVKQLTMNDSGSKITRSD